MARGAARLVAGWPAIAGWLVVLGGLVIAREQAPLGDVDALIARATLVRAEGRVVQVDPTEWEVPARAEGLEPLPVYRIAYRFLDASGQPHDGVSYTHGLHHRVRESARVEYVEGDPALSRIQRAHRRPYGPERLWWLLAPLPGLLVVLVAASRAGGRRARPWAWALPIASLALAAEIVRAVLGWSGG